MSIPCLADGWGDFYRTAMQSALGQTHANIEFVVVDRSGDKRVEAALCDEMVHDPRIRYYRRRPGCSVRVRKLCKGQWAAPILENAVWTPTHIQDMLMEAGEDAEWVTGAVRVIQPDGKQFTQPDGMYHNSLMRSYVQRKEQAVFRFYEKPVCWERRRYEVYKMPDA